MRQEVTTRSTNFNQLLEQRILETLRFFSLQGVPVTLLELHTFLLSPTAVLQASIDSDGELRAVDRVEQSTVLISEVLSALHNVIVQGTVVTQYGLYTLANRAELLQQRWAGHQYGVWREKRIRKWASKLAWIPFVRAVGIAGSQSLGLQKQGSDIDLFIITTPHFLWTARTLVTIYFQLLGIRRHGDKLANRMCLNHYIAGVKAFTAGKNVYTALEYAKLRPVFGQTDLVLFQKNNSWIKVFFPNWQPLYTVGAPLQQSVFEKAIQATFGNFLETVLRRSQIGRIKTELKFIVVEDDELSFHPNSKQEKVLHDFFKLKQE